MRENFLEGSNFQEEVVEERGIIAPISDYVELCKRKNKNLESTKLVGVSVSKEIKESLWSKKNTNLKICQLIEKGDFIVNLMNVDMHKKIALSFYQEKEIACTSSRYHVFKVTNPSLLSEYLMMLFRKGRINREAVYNCFSGVRGGLHWKDFVKIKIYIPPLKVQEKIVHKYQLIERLIELKRRINELLERWMQAYYHILFDNLSEDQYTPKTFGELFHIAGGGVHQGLILI